MMAMTRSAEKGCYETLILACDMFQLLTWAGPLLYEQLLTEQLMLFSLSFLAFQMSEPQVSKKRLSGESA
jgi:hypothetical protein